MKSPTSTAFVITLCVLLAGMALAQQASIGQPQPIAATPSPTPSPTPIPNKIGGVTLSGSVRFRMEDWSWFETDQGQSDYTFFAATLRFGFSQSRERVEWRLEGQAPLLMGLPARAIAPAPQGQLGFGGTYFAANGGRNASLIFKQGFIRFKGVFGDAASNLKIGRFEFNEGIEIIPSDPALAVVKRDHISQRLIGAFGFSHVGRSLDGLHYDRNFKAGNFTFVGARPTEGAFQLDGNKELEVDFYYGAFTRPRKFARGETEWRAFALHYHDGRPVLKTDNRPLALRSADGNNIRLTTFGGHHIGVYKAGSGKVDTLLWGAGQFGDWGNQAHRAGAIAAEAGWSPSGGKWIAKLQPWMRAGYFRSTGDGDPADDRHGTFFQILPTPRQYARLPFFNLMNNEDAFGQFRFKPQPALIMKFQARHLRLSDSGDLWYLGGGAYQKQTFGYAGRPSNGKRNLGWLFDLSGDVTISKVTTMTFYLGGVRGGNVQSAIYPQGGPNPRARFFYLELTQTF